jgi:hypothetical protein
MNRPNPTANFLISAIAASLEGLLRPFWFVMRNDMGIQHTALIPIIIAGAIYGAGFCCLSLTSEVNSKVIIVYAALIVAGYFRNTAQARRRRRLRDWSVGTCSTGESLFVPVLLFICRRVYREWGDRPHVKRWLERILSEDFVYYVMEPAALLFVAAALWSIGSSLLYYPILAAIALIVVRNDDHLWLYLKAHEIPDGKMLERAINAEFGGAAQRGAGNAIARIPVAPADCAATDNASVFERLSPEMQTVLMKDRFAHGEPLR